MNASGEGNLVPAAWGRSLTVGLGGVSVLHSQNEKSSVQTSILKLTPRVRVAGEK